MKIFKRLLVLLLSAVLIAETIPSEVFAAPEVYQIWVGEYQVTESNKDDIPGVSGGTATYNPITKVLDFTPEAPAEACTIDSVYSEEKCVLWIDESNVKLTGKLDINITDEMIEAAGADLAGILTDYSSIDIAGDVNITSAGERCAIATERTLSCGGNINCIMTSKEKTRGIGAGILQVYAGKVNVICSGLDYPSKGISLYEGIRLQNGEINVDTQYGPAISITNGKSIINAGKLTAKTKRGYDNGDPHYAIDGDTSEWLTAKMEINGGEVIAEIEDGAGGIYMWSGITLGENMEVVEPDGGDLSKDGKSIYDYKAGKDAKKIHIRKAGDYKDVIFSLNGGRSNADIPAQSIEAGAKATRPTDPRWETIMQSCTFGGWYTEKECINEYDFNTPVTESIVLYAKWTPKSYIEFKLNGHGNGYIPDQVVEAGEKVEKPDDPEDDVWRFGGWYKEAECINSFDFNTAPTGDMKLYAKWINTTDLNEATFTVNGTYTYSGATIEPDDISAEYNGEALINGTDYKIIGYKNNRNAGKGTVILEGLGKYSGRVEKLFDIGRAPLTLDKAPTVKGNVFGAKLEDISFVANTGYVLNGKNQVIAGEWMWAEDDNSVIVENGQSYKAQFIPYFDNTNYEILTEDITLTLEKSEYWCAGNKVLELYCQEDKDYIVDPSVYIADGAEVTDIIISENGSANAINSFSTELVNGKVSFHTNELTGYNPDQVTYLKIVVPETDNYQGYYFRIKIYLTDRTEQNDIVLTPAIQTLEYGESGSVAVSGNYTAITFSTINNAVATIDESGTITPVGSGRTSITAKAEAGTVEDTAYSQGEAVAIVKVTGADISKVTVALDKNAYEYTGSEIKPVPTVTYKGETLTEGTDYKLVYYDNINPGTGKLRLIARGNKFKGYKDVEFSIVNKLIKVSSVEVSDRKYIKDNTDIKIKNISFKDSDGNDFDFAPVSFNAVARVSDDKPGQNKPVSLSVTSFDENYAISEEYPDITVNINKASPAMPWSVLIEAPYGSNVSEDLDELLPEAGYEYILSSANDSGAFFDTPKLNESIISFKMNDSKELISDEEQFAAVISVPETENYKWITVFVYVKVTDKKAEPDPTPDPTPDPIPDPTPDPTPAPEPNPTPDPTPAPTLNPTPGPQPVIIEPTVSENILDPVKTEKLPDNIKLISGKSKTIKLTVSNSNAKVIKWESSDKKIATVSKKGVVKAKASGTVNITANFEDNSQECFTVCVEVPKIAKKTVINSYDNEYVVASENKIKLNITRFLDKDRYRYSEFTGFSCSSPKVCTIDENGVVTVLKNGKSTITIYYGKTKIKTMLHVQLPDIKNKTVSLAKAGKTKKVSLLNCKDKTKEYTLESSNTDVFTVDNETRKVTAVAAGEAEVILKVNGVEYDRCKVTVRK